MSSERTVTIRAGKVDFFGISVSSEIRYKSIVSCLPIEVSHEPFVFPLGCFVNSDNLIQVSWANMSETDQEIIIKALVLYKDG